MKNVAKSKGLMEEVKKALSSEFDMKDLGEINHYLGMHIIRDRRNQTIYVNQTAYINAVIKRAGMEGCNAVSMSMIPGRKLETWKGSEPSVNKHEYQHLIRGIMYAMLGT